jgi:hypothetical protein
VRICNRYIIINARVNMRKYHIPCADRINSNNLTYLKTIDGSKSNMSHKKILDGILDNKNFRST